jgi:hypothetical protein
LNFTPGTRQNLAHELEKEMHPGLHHWRFFFLPKKMSTVQEF